MRINKHLPELVECYQALMALLQERRVPVIHRDINKNAFLYTGLNEADDEPIHIVYINQRFYGIEHIALKIILIAHEFGHLVDMDGYHSPTAFYEASEVDPEWIEKKAWEAAMTILHTIGWFHIGEAAMKLWRRVLNISLSTYYGVSTYGDIHPDVEVYSGLLLESYKETHVIV